MPLKVKPVKLRDSLYLLIPVDIARLLGVAASSHFQLSLNENQDSVRLVYEMRKDEPPKELILERRLGDEN